MKDTPQTVESVNGICIGGDERIYRYALFYQGRRQSPINKAESDEAAESAGRALMIEMRKDEMFYTIYPSREVADWEIRIW